MKRFERILTHLLATGLVAGMSLNFSACSKDSPIGPDNIDTPSSKNSKLSLWDRACPVWQKELV